eukprot:CAMPEP_0204229620 /NCGR_PEP_ID=MMETSP0361-20130328/87350_1 /ASSEMBLY_ACC=CAM_ASM_000343 /TAXON_ID=268821 /ORGANISM="Scrippsiella Hangoei, Strain SHTV-5" /LENGTH=31 /DNA_ID= /DNA_START= /DNA_END= /DNA_ORIENTATION=
MAESEGVGGTPLARCGEPFSQRSPPPARAVK